MTPDKTAHDPALQVAALQRTNVQLHRQIRECGRQMEWLRLGQREQEDELAGYRRQLAKARDPGQSARPSKDQVQEALNRSRDYYRNLFDGSPTARVFQ